MQNLAAVGEATEHAAAGGGGAFFATRLGEYVCACMCEFGCVVMQFDCITLGLSDLDTMPMLGPSESMGVVG